jgi:hypothetical protein
VDAGQNLFDQLGSLESDLKDLRGRVKRPRDRQTLDNVNNGVMLGMNNPTIRARVEYGKDKHKELQDSCSCDARELSLSSGRPDCVKFDRYLNDVRDYFKDDDRSKRCAHASDGSAVYRSVGVLYPRCRP